MLRVSRAKPLLSLLAVAIVLSGCGWHLRGGGLSLDSVGSVAIVARDTRSELVTTLKRKLAAYDIAAVPAGEADYQITIFNQQTKKRTASVSGAARTAEYRLVAEVTFLIEGSAAASTGVNQPVTVFAERYFDFDETRVLANQTEQRQLQQAINDNLAHQIMAHLQKAAQQQTPPDAT